MPGKGGSMKALCRILSMVVIAAVPVFAQQPTSAPAGPAPRTPWGKPDLTGVWQGGNVGASPRGDTYNLTELDKLYQPWTASFRFLFAEKDDPAYRCLPYGWPREMTMPRNMLMQVVQSANEVYVMAEYFHTFRIIPIDGSPHPKPLTPTYLGDSVGRWEGDTLVVDVTGFNGFLWLADTRDQLKAGVAGVWPTSDALHITERWRRADSDSLEYQATIDDSKVLTAPWTTSKMVLKREPKDVKIGEAVCINAVDYKLMGETGDRK
jgi:hypothetical protein